MAEHIVDSLVVMMGLDTSNYDKGKKKVEKQTDDLAKGSKKLEGGIASLAKGFAQFFAVIASSNALVNLALDVSKANDQLNFMSKQLGISTNQIKAFQNVAEASGGSAQGMTNSMKQLNSSLIAFKTTGDASAVPAFNALGVAMVDARGNIRKTDDVMLDLADSMSKMNAQQAYFYGQKIGLDEGTVNTLIQGRDAMRDMIAYQHTLYQANKKDLENSRQLQKNRALLNAQWDSMKTLMASAVIPVLNKLALVAIQFFEFLQRHQHVVKAVFEAIAFVIGVTLTGNLAKALRMLTLFIAPFTPFIAVVTALAGAFVLLYDDYKTWADGGNSLFKWDAFTSYIDKAKISVDSLRNAFKDVWKQLKEDTLPTLKGYVDILNDVKNGQFKSAGKKALAMEKNYIGKIADTVDIATGQEKGTMREIQVVNRSNTPDNGDFNKILQKQARLGGITDPKELAAFTAITAHETGDGKRLSENTAYSYKSWQGLSKNQRNVRNWLKNHNESDFNKLSREDKLNIMYNGMNGNRTGTDDGYMYRGRGAIQITGRGEYAKLAKSLNRPDILTNPDIVSNDKSLAAQTAVMYWKNKKGVAESARSGDIGQARYLVNGGQIGMDDVMKRYQSLQSSKPTTNIDVKVGDIKVNTSSSTVSGVAQDATKAIGQNLNFIIPPQR